MKRFTNILLYIFAIGVLLALVAGALSAIGYVAALFVGGELATAICAFIYTQYFPWVIRVCSVCVGLGLIGMYLNKVKALSFDK